MLAINMVFSFDPVCMLSGPLLRPFNEGTTTSWILSSPIPTLMGGLLILKSGLVSNARILAIRKAC